MRDGAQGHTEREPVGSVDPVLALLSATGVHPVHPRTCTEFTHGEPDGCLEADIWDYMEAKQMPAKIKETTARKQNHPVKGQGKGKGKSTQFTMNSDGEIEHLMEGPMKDYSEKDWSDMH